MIAYSFCFDFAVCAILILLPPRPIHNQFRVIAAKSLGDMTIPADRHNRR
jgi:hypothetical protein